MKPAAAIFRKSGPRAPAVSLLGSIFNTSAGNHAVTATPAVGALLVVISAASGSTTAVTGVSDDQGGTYTEVASASRGTTTGEMAIYIRDQLVAAAVSHVITAAHSGNDGGGCVVLSVSNMTSTGVLAMRSFGSQNSLAAGTAAAPVLSSAPLTKNPVISVDYTGATATSSPRAGYTTQFANSHSNPTNYLTVISRDSGETSQTITWGGAPGTGQHCAAAVELLAP